MYRDIITECAVKYAKCPYLGMRGLKAMSKQYPGGEKSFWELERYSRLERLKDNALGNMWINEGCKDVIEIPDFLTVLDSSLTNFIEAAVRCVENPNIPLEKVKEIEKDIAIKEIESFFRYYLEYRAIDGLINRKPNPKGAQLKTNLTDEQLEKLFDSLVSGGFIHNTTSKEGFKWAFGVAGEDYMEFKIKWTRKKNLCAYLIDNISADYDNHWSIAERIFNIKGLRQMKNNYMGYKNGDGKPRGYLEIDTIIQSL